MYNDQNKSDHLFTETWPQKQNRIIEQDINLIHKYNIDSLAVALIVCGVKTGTFGYSTDEETILKDYIESVWEYASRKNISYPEALRAISKEAQNINNKEQGR